MSDLEFSEDAEPVEAPAVVAVVVASNPGDEFAEMLGSLAAQDYENLSVLVIDAGSDDPIADRVAQVLPGAYLHRLAGDPGWSVAANQSIELVTGSPFLLFCHDDVALADNCVSSLMNHLYQENAGIAGPKLVEWSDERKLLQLGMGADRFGVLVGQVERGEFDQGQYDSVSDVFVVPGAVQLIRSDLFVTLGGFDPEIGLIGEDLDLCWRAHALGARVLAVATTHARHRESMDERLNLRDRRKLAARHRLRTLMVTSTGRGRLVFISMAVMLIALEGIYYLITGRRGQARDMFSAIGWNFTRFGDIRRRSRALKQIRQRSRREVRALQMGGSASLNNFSRGQFTAGQDRVSGFVSAIRQSFQGQDSGSLRDATVIGLIVALILTLGSRHLLTRPIVPVGQIPIVPSASVLFNEWLGGWRSAGTGGPGNAPTAFLVLAIGRLLFFWSSETFDRVLVVGPLFIGLIGSFRLTRPLGSARSAAIASAFYAVSPVVTSSFSAGRWESMIIFAVAPAMLSSLLRLGSVSPYGNQLGSADSRISSRSLPVLSIRYGFLVAAVATFVPSVIFIGVLMPLALLLVSPLSDGTLRWRSYGLAVLTGFGAPVALHGPWSFDIVRTFSWSWLIGSPSPEADIASFRDVLLFSPGDPDSTIFSAGMIVAAGLGLLLSSRRFFRFAVQAWMIAFVMFAILWLEGRGLMPFSVPPAESLLAVAAAALSLAIATAVRGIESGELAGKAWPRRLAYSSMGVAVFASAVGGIVFSFSGSWDSPIHNYARFTELLAERNEDTGRVLWIGDPSVVPVDVLSSASGVTYAVTDGGLPEVWGRWLPGSVGATDGVGYHLDLARSGQTVRLGRLLAPYGVDFVVVVDQLAPAPYVGPTIDPGDGVVGSLTQQLDLERVTGIPDLIVFRNAASTGILSALPTAEAALATVPADQLAVDLVGSPAVDAVRLASGRWAMQADGQQPLMLSVPVKNLRVNGQKDTLSSGFDGLTVVPAEIEGVLEISYPVPITRRLGLILQILVVGTGAILAQTRREAEL